MKLKLRFAIILSLVSLTVLPWLRQIEAESPKPQLSQAERERRMEVMQRHEKRLRQTPDVLGLLGSEEEIIIVTDRPEAMPKEIEGVPVKTIPPPPTLPPPSGVIVLRPEGRREHLKDASTCPPGFIEDTKYRWRFCIDPANPQPIPSGMMTPPVAGIPYEEAEKIAERSVEQLGKLPGVKAIMLGEGGITVETDRPELIAGSIEGLPVKVIPPREYRELTHTKNSPLINPFHGSTAIGHGYSGASTTSSGVVLSDGKPWMIASAHLLTGRCASVPNCDTCDPPNACSPTYPLKLNQCPHYSSNPQDLIIGTPNGPSLPTIGYASRWTQTANGNSPDSDNMAFFLDNDQVDGNGSLSVDRKLESYPTFTGGEAVPMMNDPVKIVGAQSHLYYGTIDQTYIAQTTVPASCLPSGSTHIVTSQFEFKASSGSEQATFTPGNSGAPVLDSQGRIIGIHNWSTLYPTATYGGGTTAGRIRLVQGFDAWYGTETIKDNTIGIFRSSTATWYLDNGNGKYEGSTSAPLTATRDQFVLYGIGTDIPVTGDWDNAIAGGVSNNDVTVGVYRPTGNPTYFYLSNRNDAPATVITMAAGPDSFGYRPVSGKWQGNNGAINSTTKVGVFRPSTGGWYLDSGNFNSADGCGIDYCFSLAAGMYQANDIPLAGDWNGDGIVSIGLFHPGGPKRHRLLLPQQSQSQNHPHQ